MGFECVSKTTYSDADVFRSKTLKIEELCQSCQWCGFKNTVPPLVLKSNYN